MSYFEISPQDYIGVLTPIYSVLFGRSPGVRSFYPSKIFFEGAVCRNKTLLIESLLIITFIIDYLKDNWAMLSTLNRRQSLQKLCSVIYLFRKRAKQRVSYLRRKATKVIYEQDGPLHNSRYLDPIGFFRIHSELQVIFKNIHQISLTYCHDFLAYT